MTLEWHNSTDKRLFSLSNLPNSLKRTLIKIWQQHYEELYEPEADGNASLQDALVEILELFRDSNGILGQLRYVWMALILASVVRPKIEYYQPNNSIPENTIIKLEVWLIETIEEMINYKKRSERDYRKEANVMINAFRGFSECQKIGSFQILSEALDVYSSAIKTLDRNQSLEALLDILDDCLEGYAIFPGSYGRRELFDWWLLDVVPASWYLLPPSQIYSIDKLGNDKNIAFRQMDKLEKISSEMWLIMLTAYHNKDSIYLQNFCTQINYQKDIELNVDLQNINLCYK